MTRDSERGAPRNLLKGSKTNNEARAALRIFEPVTAASPPDAKHWGETGGTPEVKDEEI